MKTTVSKNKNSIEKNVDDIIQLFNDCFQASENTILSGGAQEPIYKPAQAAGQCNQVVFTHDYFSSALHEIAHWCIAGKERRKKIDYGYWYAPDGRTIQQQKAFELAEIKPQALEYAFSIAANIKFNVSIDNLQGEASCSLAFKQSVEKQLQHYIAKGFNARSAQFLYALHDFYGTPCLSEVGDLASNNPSIRIDANKDLEQHKSKTESTIETTI